jgi:hypothetical protein
MHRPLVVDEATQTEDETVPDEVADLLPSRLADVI